MLLKLLKYSFEKRRSKAVFMNSKVVRVRIKSPRNIQNALSKTQQDLSLISCTATVLIKRMLRKQHKYTEWIQDNKHSEMHIRFLKPYNNSAHWH